MTPRRISIMCAIADDTPAPVVEASRRLARELDGRVVLAHAFDEMEIAMPPSEDLVVAGVTVDDLAVGERQRAETRLQSVAEGLAGVEHTTELVDGPPVAALLRLAEEHSAALVVTGTAVRGALDRILVGSVASELAATAPCPVVVVPADAAVGLEGPVVAGYDGSDHSMRAARHAAALAAHLGRELVLMHVAEGETPPIRADAELARALHEAVSAAPPPRPQRLDATVAVAEGDPAAQLADAGRERGAALLVTGTRGRGALTSALLGSVSSGVVRQAGRPVVLVGPAAGAPRAG